MWMEDKTKRKERNTTVDKITEERKGRHSGEDNSEEKEHHCVKETVVRKGHHCEDMSGKKRTLQ